MLPRFRLFISHYIGFWMPPIGVWEYAPPSLWRKGYFMRSLTPSGTWVYRPMTVVEELDFEDMRAW